jgi:MinD-like ATPase involved in chromosome partitioning or flagellar assembly
MGQHARSVITFYSFKGGVGRSFALADVSVVLARWGYRVLCVDFDLEAPGLERFLPLAPGAAVESGVLDVLEAWTRDEDGFAAANAVEVGVDGVGDRLHLLAAGRRDERYVQRLHQLDWNALFAEHDGGQRLEAVRERWLETYDFVLVDSRTGWSDIGEICTIHLPDLLVTLFTPNDQSLDGALAVAEKARAAARRLPVDRAPLRIVPVLTRLDKDEYHEMSRWSEEFIKRASPFVADWDPEGPPAPEVLSELVVPYVPYWSYGERLAVLRKEIVSSLSVARSHENLAALLAHNLFDAERLRDDRDGYLAKAARNGGDAVAAPGRDRFDVFISYPKAFAGMAAALGQSLNNAGVRVFVDLLHSVPGSMLNEEIKASISSANIILIIVPHTSFTEYSAYQFAALRELEDPRHSNKTYVPIELGDGPFYHTKLTKNRIPIKHVSAKISAIAQIMNKVLQLPNIKLGVPPSAPPSP